MIRSIRYPINDVHYRGERLNNNTNNHSIKTTGKVLSVHNKKLIIIAIDGSDGSKSKYERKQYN